MDASGRTVRPEEPNGCKFEMFVFDALPMAERTLIMEVDRRDDFAPVKNLSGEDSVDSARVLLVDQFSRWLEEAGVAVPRDDAGKPIHPVEISPLFARDAEELRRELTDPKSLKIDEPLLLDL